MDIIAKAEGVRYTPPRDFNWSEIHSVTDFHPTRRRASWPAFVRRFHQPAIRPVKEGPAWLPALFGDRPNHKGNLRYDGNVDAVSALVLDLDGKRRNYRCEELQTLLDGWTFVAHTTHSHTPQLPRWRVVFPLPRPLPAGRAKAAIITVKASSPSEAAFQKDSASLRSALDLAQKRLEQRRQEVRSQLEEDARIRARNEERASRTLSPRERYAAALALERMLAGTVVQLDEQTGRKNRVGVDLADVKAEITKAEDIMDRAGKKIDAIEIEQNAPPRVREFGDGKIVQPDEGERKLWTIASVSLVGLGVVVLVFAVMGFRASKPPDLPAQDSHPATA